MIRLVTLATALVTACGFTATEPTAPAGGGKADGETPSITFTADFQESLHGALLAGTSVRIAYDLDRLTDCRAESGGSDVWGVTGWAQFDVGAPASFALSRLDGGHAVATTADLAIPAGAGHVAMWFTQTNTYGCIAYDSNDSANYQFDIDRHGVGAVLAFEADLTESQSAPIHAADGVVIHFAPERLAQCAAETNGSAAWGITGHWQVDQGAIHDVFVAHAEGTELVAADPTITVPRGRDLALWFEANNIYGCHAYDSNLGANYHATIE